MQRTCSSTFLALPIMPACSSSRARGAPERRAAHAALEAGLVRLARRVSAPPPLLQLPQHQVELVEVGELADALVQQLQLLQETEHTPIRTHAGTVDCHSALSTTGLPDKRSACRQPIVPVLQCVSV